MIFQTTLDRKAIKEIVKKKSGIKNIGLYISVVVGLYIISFLAIYTGIRYKDKFFVFLGMIPFTEITTICCLTVRGIFIQPYQIFKKNNISEYVVTVKFEENNVNVSNNIHTGFFKINYDRIRSFNVSENYLIFDTKSSYFFPIVKSQLSQSEMQQFEEFIKEKMPQINFDIRDTDLGRRL